MNRLTQQEIVAQIEPILKRYNIPKAFLFGSVVNGDSDEQSDVDILVEYRPVARFLIYPLFSWN